MDKNIEINARRKMERSQAKLLWDSLVQNKLFKYQGLFDSNMIGVAATDFEDTVISANDAFLTVIGYSKDDVATGRLTWSAINPKKYEETDNAKVDELLKNGRIIPFEKEYIHKDGHSIPVLVGAEMINDSPLGVCFAVDISNLIERDRKKSEFIGMVSHELRTPLSVIKFSAETLDLLIRTGEKKELLLEAVKEINDYTDKIKFLITDLLQIARYQQNESSFLRSGVDLHECTKKVVVDISRVSNREITFKGKKNTYILGNYERLSQVVTNLINNAVKYSAASTEVIVRVTSDEKNAYVDIIDQGIGIEKNNIKKIFDNHYRINHTHDDNETGMGIGLYICSEIIKSHSGAIHVKSELGKGSTFTIELPKI